MALALDHSSIPTDEYTLAELHGTKTELPPTPSKLALAAGSAPALVTSRADGTTTTPSSASGMVATALALLEESQAVVARSKELDRQMVRADTVRRRNRAGLERGVQDDGDDASSLTISLHGPGDDFTADANANADAVGSSRRGDKKKAGEAAAAAAAPSRVWQTTRHGGTSSVHVADIKAARGGVAHTSLGGSSGSGSGSGSGSSGNSGDSSSSSDGDGDGDDGEGWIVEVDGNAPFFRRSNPRLEEAHLVTYLQSYLGIQNVLRTDMLRQHGPLTPSSHQSSLSAHRLPPSTHHYRVTTHPSPLPAQASLASLAANTASLERERANLTRQVEQWLIPNAEDYLTSLASSRPAPSTLYLAHTFNASATNSRDRGGDCDGDGGHYGAGGGGGGERTLDYVTLEVPSGEPLLASDLAPVTNGCGAQVIFTNVYELRDNES